MASRKNKYLNWLSSHKRELVIAGIGMIAFGSMIVVLKNQSTLRKMCVIKRKNLDTESIKTVSENIKGTSLMRKKKGTARLLETHSFKTPHSVRTHLRTLPEGWKPSAEKVAMAAEYGYNLNPGQTWVARYNTGGLVA